MKLFSHIGSKNHSRKWRVASFNICLFLFMAPPCKAERIKVTPRVIRVPKAYFIEGQPEVGDKAIEIKLGYFLKKYGLTLQEFLQIRRVDPADARIQLALDHLRFDSFLSDREIQVVRNPLGQFQKFDGHHLGRTLDLLEIDDFKAVLWEDFWYADPIQQAQDLPERMREYERYMV